MSKTQLIMHGASGRMGRRIVTLARESADFDVVAELDRGTPAPGLRADVVIDFSVASAALTALGIARSAGANLLVGTTGLSDGTLGELKSSAQECGILVAPNTSIGVALIASLAAEAARRLPAHFDIEIVEAHHRHKLDAPSGTALRLAGAIEADGGRRVGPDQVHALRCGDVVGEHTVVFAGDEQVIRISHSAGSRDVFARGALHAAAWLHGRSAGWYTIEDAIGRGTA